MSTRHAAAALIVLVTACTHPVHDEALVRAPVVRAAFPELETKGSATVRDDAGATHRVEAATWAAADVHLRLENPLLSAHVDTTLGALATQCAHGSPCPTDDAGAIWTLTTEHSKFDLRRTAIAATGLALVGSNVACFGADACPGSVRTAVGITDVTLLVAAVGLTVAMVVAWSNFHGS